MKIKNKFIRFVASLFLSTLTMTGLFVLAFIISQIPNEFFAMIFIIGMFIFLVWLFY